MSVQLHNDPKQILSDQFLGIENDKIKLHS